MNGLRQCDSNGGGNNNNTPHLREPSTEQLAMMIVKAHHRVLPGYVILYEDSRYVPQDLPHNNQQACPGSVDITRACCCFDPWRQQNFVEALPATCL